MGSRPASLLSYPFDLLVALSKIILHSSTVPNSSKYLRRPSSSACRTRRMHASAMGSDAETGERARAKVRGKGTYLPANAAHKHRVFALGRRLFLHGERNPSTCLGGGFRPLFRSSPGLRGWLPPRPSPWVSSGRRSLAARAGGECPNQLPPKRFRANGYPPPSEHLRAFCRSARRCRWAGSSTEDVSCWTDPKHELEICRIGQFNGLNREATALFSCNAIQQFQPARTHGSHTQIAGSALVSQTSTFDALPALLASPTWGHTLALPRRTSRQALQQSTQPTRCL